MRARWILYSATILLGVVAIARPAAALTGGDVLDGMNTDQRGGYLAGAIEMAAFQLAAQGNTERGNCVMGWFYDKKGTDEIVAALARFKDRQALPVIQALIERACGK